MLRAMGTFKLHAEYEPRGDQPRAIQKLIQGLRDGKRFQMLLGVTGSGKTFTIANAIREFDMPVLVISHNKTLAAQLYSEFRAFFPENAVEYFVSYYDYYQPEAYVPQKDLYIEKDASINEDLDRLRLSATSSVISRRDVIVVASVSCIYGLGSPVEYEGMMVKVAKGEELDRTDLLRRLTRIQYSRTDAEFKRGAIRVRGDVVEVFPAYEKTAVRIELFGDAVEAIAEVDPLTGEVLRESDTACIYPAKHFVIPDGTIESAIGSIEEELEERVEFFRSRGKLIEAQRLESRTRYDMELLREIGYCPGIENYSRHLSGRAPGERPYCLIDYFPEEFLLVIDESHATVPQVAGMYVGDRNRKLTLVEHGFRLPSALDNRPMRFAEFEDIIHRCVFLSATPGPYELKRCKGELVEQLIRPTGLIDPPIEIRPARGQVRDLVGEVRQHVERKERVLVTTLTKRTAEELSEFLKEEGVSCAYLHSEIDAFERVDILRRLRMGKFDVIVGVNLLREGLDLPEVALVAVLDADKRGFLRSQTSLTQTIGRTARNVNGQVILYADEETDAIKKTVSETSRRREAQLRFNAEHGITPETIRSAIKSGIEEILSAEEVEREQLGLDKDRFDLTREIGELEREMYRLAEELRFEEAAALRDRILELRGERPRATPRRFPAASSGRPRRRRGRKRRAKT